MATKQRLHELIDELPDSEVDAVADFLASRGEDDPVLQAFQEAPEDDEPWTEQDEAAIAEVEADSAAGVPLIPFEEIKQKYKLP